MTASATGDLNSEIRYTAFGTIRYENGTTPTDYRYTGQLQQAVIGLDYYNARWYDPQLGRFIQADTVVANPYTAASYDRYSYVANNPINHNDPTGHFWWVLAGAAIGAAISYGAQVAYNYHNGMTGTSAWTNVNGSAIVSGALLGAGAVLFAPAVVSLAADALRGTALITGSTGLFTAGASAYSLANIVEANVAFGSPFSKPVPILQYDSNASGITQADGAAQANGQSRVQTYADDPALTKANRAQSLKGYDTSDEFQRHEYPYASSLEGGKGASVTYVNPSENASHGRQMAQFFSFNSSTCGSVYYVQTWYAPQITWPSDYYFNYLFGGYNSNIKRLQ